MKGKRYLSGFLALVMLLSMALPLHTLAADSTPITAADGKVDAVVSNTAFTFSPTGWTHSTSVGRFGDTYCGGAPGATVEVAFTGQGITFLTTKHAGAGAFKVYLDGVYQVTGTTFTAGPAQLQQCAYAVWGLDAGSHILKIEAVGSVEVDALEVFASDPDLTTAVTVSSAGDAAKIEEVGGTLQLSAATTPAEKAVTWSVTTAKGAATNVATIDQNGLLTAVSNGVVRVTALADDGTWVQGSKLISVRGQSAATEKWDDRDSRLAYAGQWKTWNDSNDYLGTETYSAVNGDTLSFSFEGTGFRLYTMRNTPLKSFSVTVDDEVLAEDVSTAGALQYQYEAYSVADLAAVEGEHKVLITATGKITFDALEITLPGAAIADITAVDPVAPIEVVGGVLFEELPLPETVGVTVGGTAEAMAVCWEPGDYDPAVSGAYTLSGILLYGAAQDNSTDLKASVTVTVSATDSAAPRIGTQPAAQAVLAPASATFSVAATSPDGGALTYQWQTHNGTDWVNVPDATAASYTISTTTVAMNGAQYRCSVTNTKGSLTSTTILSSAASLKVSIDHSKVNVLTALDGKVDDIAPAFTYTGSWANQVAVGRFNDTYRCGGVGASADIAFTGRGISFYSFNRADGAAFEVYVDGVYQGAGAAAAIPTGQTAYTVFGLTDGAHTMTVKNVGTGSTVWLELDAAQVLTANPVPDQTAEITTSPANQAVNEPSTATFTVAAAAETGGGTARYQWQKFVGAVWTNLAGATEASYTTAATTVAADHNTKYRCVVTNSKVASSVLAISGEAVLSVNVKPDDVAAAPVVGTAPTAQSAVAPAAATFSVAATSPDDGTLTYQWQSLAPGEDAVWANISGATAAQYTTPATNAAMSGTQYRCTITNGKPSFTPTAVTTAAVALTVTLDHTAVTVITATDGTVDDIAPAFTYTGTWATQTAVGRFNDTYRCGSAGTSAEIAFSGKGLTFLTTKHGEAGTFKVYVDGVYQGSGTARVPVGTVLLKEPAYTVWGLSDGAHTLRVECLGSLEVDAARVPTTDPALAEAVTISTQPVSVTANEADAATFTVTATPPTDGGALLYQWQKLVEAKWVNLAGADGASYTTPATTIAGDNGTKFRCVVTNSKVTAAALAVSDVAVLTVVLDATTSKAPQIALQPKDKSVSAPLKANFTVAATSPDNGTLAYQWQSLAPGEDAEWANILGATAAQYTTAATAVELSGTQYRCQVTNTAAGLNPKTVDSAAATLTVTPAKAQTSALDAATGRLDVDYANYLSRHDVVYKSPVEDGVNGSTVGNGRMGGMIWNKDGLQMEVTNVDAAPYSCIPSGLVTYRSSPMPQAVPGKFEQRLNLHAGTVTTEYGDGLKFTFMGDPDSELLGIHVEDGRENVTESSIDLSLWLDELNAEPNAPFGSRPYGNPSIVFPNEETWLTPDFTVRDNYVAITRGQEDPNYFGYTIALSVEGADYTTKLVGAGNDKKLRLSVDPADKEYTIWIANPSRRHAAEHDTLAAAEAMVAQARSYDAVYARFTGFWDEFWNRCFVEYQSDTNSDADYLENSWYLYQYLIGCGSRGEFPFHFMNGVWRGEEQDEGLWSWDYTSFNERTFAYTHFATNRLDQTDSYYYMLIHNVESGMRYTADRFWKNDKDPRFDPSNPAYIPGSILSPERTTWDGVRQVGYDGQEKGCPYTTHVNATAAEHAMGMYERYEYTGDKAFLEDAYPFIRGVGVYLLNFLKFDPLTQTYYSDNSNALEQYWRVKNPINDLASFPALMERAILAAEALDVDPELRVLWQDRIDHLSVPVTEAGSNGPRYQPHDPPRTPQKNSQNPELDVVWPFNRVGLYQESARGFDFETAKTSYIDRKMPLNIWTPEPIVSARLGLGDDSFKHEIGMIGRSQTRVNGIHADGNGSFESNALVLTAVGEELLQSYNNKIVVFPAVMSDPTFRSKFTLLARGGFLVSSEYEDGAVKYIALISQLGGTATVINPWGAGEAVTVRNLTTDEVLLQTADLEFSFETAKDGKYVVELDSRPLASFTVHETITAARNEGPKTLSVNRRTLGIKGASAVVDPTPITATQDPVNETNEAFLWSGQWSLVTAADRFGGASQSTATPGNSVDIVFQGEGIEFYTTRRADSPVFAVYIDGVYQGSGSAVGTPLSKQLKYAVFGLTDGKHTLTVKHAGIANQYLEVDAVRVLAADPGLVTSLTVAAAGGAETITAKGGTLQMTATVAPTGKAVLWTVTDLAGKAATAASVDGAGLLTAKANGQVRVTATAADVSLKSDAKIITISGQSSEAKTIAAVTPPEGVTVSTGTAFEKLSLPAEVTVTLTGGGSAQIPVLWQKGDYNGETPDTYAISGTLLYGAAYENPNNVTASIAVTVKRVTVMTEKIDDRDLRVKYTGRAEPWTDAGNYMKSQTDIYGSGTCTLEFIGTKISIYAMKNPARGTFTVAIDGSAPVTVSTKGTQEYQHLFYTSPVLTDAVHTMVITVPAPASNYVAFDAFEVTLGKQPPAIVSLTTATKQVPHGLAFGELGLPETIAATLDNGVTAQVSVVWDPAGYEPNRTGNQRITGEVKKGGTIYSNPDKHYAVAELNVAAGESLYTVSFTGGLDTTGTAPIQASVKAGGTFTLPQSNYAKEGFLFGGWYDGSKVYQAGDAYTMPARNVLFTVNWLPTLTAEYTVAYTGGAGAEGTAPDGKTVKAGVLFVLPDNPFTMPGFRFAGWYDGSNVYAEGVTYAMPARNVTFTAQWQPSGATTYTVTFNRGNDSAVGDVPAQADTKAGGSFELPANPFTLPGFLFAGWNDGSKVYAPGDIYIMPAQNVILAAKWQENQTNLYAVTFTGGYGATGDAPKQDAVKAGGTFTLPTNTFAKPNAVFTGWSDGSKVYQPGDTYTMPAHAAFFTAQWTGIAPNPAPGGDNSGSRPTEKRQETITITPTATVKDGAAEVSISQKDADKLVRDAKEKSSSSVVIAPTVNGDSVKTTVKLPADIAKKLAKDTTADLTVKTPQGSVTIDHGQLGKVTDVRSITVEQRTDGTVSILTGTGVPLRVEIPAGKGNVVAIIRPDSTTEILPKSFIQDGVALAHLPCDAVIQIINNSKPFADVASTDWFAPGVEFASSHALFAGVSETRFAPTEPMTRAMVVTVLHRLEGKPQAETPAGYADVSADVWYGDAISWATEAGISGGQSADTFHPSGEISRQELALMLYRYAKVLGMDTAADTGAMDAFTDAHQVSPWASEAMNYAVRSGLLAGQNGSVLNPGGSATRAEVATVLQRFVEQLAMAK